MDDYLVESAGLEARTLASGCICCSLKAGFVETIRALVEQRAPMFPNAEQVVVIGIEEMDFGAFGGRTANDMEDDAAYREWVEGGCEGLCPGGESRAEFSDRVCAALAQLCRDAAARGEDRVVVVAHGGRQMAFLSRFAPEPRGYYEWLTGNCEGWHLDVRLGNGDSCLAIESVARFPG